MLLKCCLLHRGLCLLYYQDKIMFHSYVLYICLYVLVYSCLNHVICFFITIDHMISLTQKNLLFVCQKFSLRALLSFYLIFCQFQPGVAYKSVAYKKKLVYVPAIQKSTKELILISNLTVKFLHLFNKFWSPLQFLSFPEIFLVSTKD